mmetsp:Transcript_135854/g.434678  ORF Transcript_135854/g.434678 Transcript_135854/m.434678 type:complete len:215 (+) Transcript_135854:398-1042(+)
MPLVWCSVRTTRLTTRGSAGMIACRKQHQPEVHASRGLILSRTRRSIVVASRRLTRSSQSTAEVPASALPPALPVSRLRRSRVLQRHRRRRLGRPRSRSSWKRRWRKQTKRWGLRWTRESSSGTTATSWPSASVPRLAPTSLTALPRGRGSASIMLRWIATSEWLRRLRLPWKTCHRALTRPLRRPLQMPKRRRTMRLRRNLPCGLPRQAWGQP